MVGIRLVAPEGEDLRYAAGSHKERVRPANAVELSFSNCSAQSRLTIFVPPARACVTQAEENWSNPIPSWACIRSDDRAISRLQTASAVDSERVYCAYNQQPAKDNDRTTLTFESGRLRRGI